MGQNTLWYQMHGKVRDTRCTGDLIYVNCMVSDVWKNSYVNKSICTIYGRAPTYVWFQMYGRAHIYIYIWDVRKVSYIKILGIGLRGLFLKTCVIRCVWKKACVKICKWWNFNLMRCRGAGYFILFLFNVSNSIILH